MQLEFHQLDRRFEHLRVRDPGRHRRLLASLADTGQQTPIVVVALADRPDRYLVIDGYKRLAALKQLGRDTVTAVAWPMGEAEALLLDRSQRMSEQESALEQGWLLQEMEQRYGYSTDELARRFDRSRSWVLRRLALVELLPDSVQQQVRDGQFAAQVAMKYLVPVARVSLADCQRMAAAFAAHRHPTRQAAQLYAAWRDATPPVRQRILAEPDLFLRARQQVAPSPQASTLLQDLETALAIVTRAGRRLTHELDHAEGEDARRKIDRLHAQLDHLIRKFSPPSPEEEAVTHVDAGAADHDAGAASEESADPRDCQPVEAIAAGRPYRAPLELHRRAGDPAPRQGRPAPGANPRVTGAVSGESRASP
jgi:ParB/RepB/Spo0J family partition protein